MSEHVTTKIAVSIDRWYHPIYQMVNHIILWLLVIGAIGVSQTWFGGSIIVTLIAIGFSIGLIVRLGLNASGRSVRMTREEIRDWVRDGMPDNVAEWRAANNAMEINPR